MRAGVAEWSLLGRNYPGTAAVCMCGVEGGGEGRLVLCFVKRALSFLEVAGLSGNRRAAT